MSGRILSRNALSRLAVPVGPLFATGSAIVILRMLLEDLLEMPHQLNPGLTFYENLVDLSHVFLCWWLVILTISIGLAFALAHPLRNILSAVILGLPLILTVPLVDSMFSGGAGYMIQYQHNLNELPHVISLLFHPFREIPGISPGI